MITPTTPTGTRTDIAHLSASRWAWSAPNMRRPSPAMRRPCRSPSCTSPRVSARILPISRVIRSASASFSSVNELGEAEEDLGAPRRGHEPPLLVGRLRGRDRPVHVLRRRTSGTCRAARRSPGSATRRSRRPRRRPTPRRCSSGRSPAHRGRLYRSECLGAVAVDVGERPRHARAAAVPHQAVARPAPCRDGGPGPHDGRRSRSRSGCPRSTRPSCRTAPLRAHGGSRSRSSLSDSRERRRRTLGRGPRSSDRGQHEHPTRIATPPPQAFGCVRCTAAANPQATR